MTTTTAPRGTATMDQPNDATTKALQDLHADPFVQAAIFRLWCHAPETLSAPVQVLMAQANPPADVPKTCPHCGQTTRFSVCRQGHVQDGA